MDHNCHIFILEYEHHPFFKCHLWIFASVLPRWVSSNWIIILKALKLAVTTPKEKRVKEHFSAKLLFLKILLNNNPILSIEMMHPVGNEFSTFIIFQNSKHFKGLFKVKFLEHNLVTASKGRRHFMSLLYLGGWQQWDPITMCFFILIWDTEKQILQEKPSDVTCKPNFPEWERLELCWTLRAPFSCLHCNKSELSLGIEDWALQDQVSLLFVPSFCQFITSVSLGAKGNVLKAIQGSLGLKNKKGSLRVCCDIITPKGLYYY